MPDPCIFILKYPTESSPTATFQPARGAVLQGSKINFKSNAIVHVMADPRIHYTYIKGGQFRERTYSFLLDDAEVNTFYTFWSTVLGNSFKLLDPLTDPGYILQRFSPESSLDPEVTLTSDGMWTVTLTFRDALS
jgi:hypothetical protein